MVENRRGVFWTGYVGCGHENAGALACEEARMPARPCCVSAKARYLSFLEMSSRMPPMSDTKMSVHTPNPVVFAFVPL